MNETKFNVNKLYISCAESFKGYSYRGKKISSSNMCLLSRTSPNYAYDVAKNRLYPVVDNYSRVEYDELTKQPVVYELHTLAGFARECGLSNINSELTREQAIEIAQVICKKLACKEQKNGLER